MFWPDVKNEKWYASGRVGVYINKCTESIFNTSIRKMIFTCHRTLIFFSRPLGNIFRNLWIHNSHCFWPRGGEVTAPRTLGRRQGPRGGCEMTCWDFICLTSLLILYPELEAKQASLGTIHFPVLAASPWLLTAEYFNTDGWVLPRQGDATGLEQSPAGRISDCQDDLLLSRRAEFKWWFVNWQGGEWERADVFASVTHVTQGYTGMGEGPSWVVWKEWEGLLRLVSTPSQQWLHCLSFWVLVQLFFVSTIR